MVSFGKKVWRVGEERMAIEGFLELLDLFCTYRPL